MTGQGDQPAGRLRSVFRWLMEPGKSLGSRAVNAGLWASALSVSMRLLRLVRTVLLARLLAPNDFGLMGIAVITLSMIEAFTKTGINQALIQRKGKIDDYLSTAWTVGVLRGLILGGVLIAGAPLAARFFGSPEAVALIRVIGLIPIAHGLTNVGVVFFDKELQFRQRFLFRSLPAIVELAVSVALALWLRNVWALLLGRVIAQIVTMVASYVAHPYRPRFRLDKTRARELMRFGKWIWVSSILIYLMLNLDDIMVGRLLSPEDLGLYQMAFTISTLVTIEIAHVVNQVAFPAFSKIQSDPQALGRAYLETVQLVAFAALPMAAGLWFVGPVAVETLLGENWLGLLPAYGPLLIWGLVRSVTSSANALFASIGKPSVNAAMYAFVTVLLAIFIFPFTMSWGIAGAAWATVIAAGGFVVQYALASRKLKTGWRSVVRPVAIPATITAVMLLALKSVTALLPESESTWLLVWAPALGAIVYSLGVMTAQRYFDYTPLKVLSRFARRHRDEASGENEQ